MNEKLLIYPYDRHFTPILRHNCLDKYQISVLVSPNGWGGAGMDVSTYEYSSPLGLNVTSDFESALLMCDAVLFTQSDHFVNFDKLIYPKILKSINAGKNIICTITLEGDIFNKIKEECNKKNVDFIYYNSLSNESIDYIDSEKIHKVNIPIIFVFGMGEQTNKFEIQLALRNYFKNKGYKVSQIGSRTYCELLGFHSIPGFMFSTKVKENEKIILFNRFIKYIELMESPDLILIGIPGGIMPLNHDFTNNFGIFAYEISQATKPDASIFSMYYDNLNNKILNNFQNLVRYKFGFEIDCFNISNVKFDWNTSRIHECKQYITISPEKLDEKKQELVRNDIQIFDVLNKNDRSALSKYLEEKLVQYSAIDFY